MSAAPRQDSSKTVEWFHTTMEALYSGTGDEEDVAKVNNAFDNAFTPESKVAVNHAPCDLPSFKQLLLDGRGVVKSVTVEWNDDIEVETDDHSSVRVLYRESFNSLI